MKTSTKIWIGGGAAALTAAGLYAFFSQNASAAPPPMKSAPKPIMTIVQAPLSSTALPLSTVVFEHGLLAASQLAMVIVAHAKRSDGTPLLQPADGSTVTFNTGDVSGTVGTPAWVKALQQVQAILATAGIARRGDGQLDYQTAAALLSMAAQVAPTRPLAMPQIQSPTTEAVGVAQAALLRVLARGKLPGAPTGSSPWAALTRSFSGVTGDPTTPGFVSALASYQSQFSGILRQDGVLDWPTWGAVVMAGAGP
jgi:hypothetical protein